MSEINRAKLNRDALSSREFDRLRNLAYKHSGLNIEIGKEELVAARLGKVMRQLGISSYKDYYDFVVGDKTSQALVAMIDSLTTNYTSFFREQQHFDFLANTIFPLLSHRSKVTLWSAACSTGEEAFSIAIAAREFFASAGPEVHIIATDISTRALATARNATYEADKVRNIPEDILRRYLLRGVRVADGFFRVRQEIQSAITFQRMNLMESFEGLNNLTFPLIFCRNVMIYFDAPTQEQLVRRFHSKIEPGGYLFIGHSESLNRIQHEFEYICPAVYRKPGILRTTRERGVE